MTDYLQPLIAIEPSNATARSNRNYSTVTKNINTVCTAHACTRTWSSHMLCNSDFLISNIIYNKNNTTYVICNELFCAYLIKTVILKDLVTGNCAT